MPYNNRNLGGGGEHGSACWEIYSRQQYETGVGKVEDTGLPRKQIQCRSRRIKILKDSGWVNIDFNMGQRPNHFQGRKRKRAERIQRF